MKKFSNKEKKFLETHEECRIATSYQNIPHVKPVSYLYFENHITIATDYDTKTFANITKNPKVALVIDIYKPGKHKAICVQGNSLIIENGKEYNKMFEAFFEKFQWVRNEPWNENEAPFLKIIPKNIISWGL